MLSSLGVRAVSATTPLGNDVRQTCAALRAGISRFREQEEYTCFSPDAGAEEPEEPIPMATSPAVDPSLQGRDRLLALCLHAFQGLIQDGDLLRRDLEENALLLALPAADPALESWEPLDDFADELTARAGLGKPAVCEVLQAGHAGFFSLVSRACQLVEEGSIRRCIVGGADTYCCVERLGMLDEATRIKSGRNQDGFIPGEAALFCSLARPEASAGCPLIGKVSEGSEPQTIEGELNSTGRGLTESLRPLVGSEPWGRVFCDLNGERYRAAEWGSVYVRMSEHFAEKLTLIHPADCLGDVGAASGGLLLSCAVEGLRLGYVREPEVLLWTSSDDGRRSALTLRPSSGDTTPRES